MMNHGKHTYLMIGVAIVAGALYLTGTISAGWALGVFVAACIVMMMDMMRGMRAAAAIAAAAHDGGGRHGKPEDIADRGR